MKTNQTSQSLPPSRFARQSLRRGFTLIQILLVLGIIAILATVSMGVFRQGRATAQRAACDVNVKAIAIALDAYREENGHYPQDLNELVTKKYIKDVGSMHCPADPRPNGSYAEYYIPRASKKLTLPTLVCPLHERLGYHGVQAFTGLNTKQFDAKPAFLTGAFRASVERPGEKPVNAVGGMEVHGGDRIMTGSDGSATIKFFDGTTCALGPSSDLTVLQSFQMGSSAKSTVYSLVHQVAGTVEYIINHGSRFDAVTPAATAGALGTRFTIKVDGTKTKLYVTEGSVYLTTTTRMVLAPLGQWLNDVTHDVLNLPVLPVVGGLLNGLLGGLFG